MDKRYSQHNDLHIARIGAKVDDGYQTISLYLSKVACKKMVR
jgi:hypothetical protein